MVDVRAALESLERSKLIFDVVKWSIVAVGAVVSFGILGYGRLKLENLWSYAENQRLLFQAYLTATEAFQPDAVTSLKLRATGRDSAPPNAHAIQWNTLAEKDVKRGFN